MAEDAKSPDGCTTHRRTLRSRKITLQTSCRHGMQACDHRAGVCHFLGTPHGAGGRISAWELSSAHSALARLSTRSARHGTQVRTRLLKL